MPNEDSCVLHVIAALAKLGYVLERKQVPLLVQRNRYVFVDLRMRSVIPQEIQTFLIEVKCFNRPKTLMEEVYQSIGQFQIYRSLMAYNLINEPIFLAVSKEVYSSTLSLPSFQNVLNETNIRLLVINYSNEEVVLWQR